MTGESVLACPSCRRTRDALVWQDEAHADCRYCQADFEVVPFPALHRTRAVAKPQAAAVADDSTCFFHATNQAEQVCDGCGRFLCTVCAIPNGGSSLCHACMAGQRQKETAVPSRTVLGTGALALAVLPMLIWFATLVTAPIVLGLVVVGWRKPGSLVHGRQRWKFVLAGLIACAQLVGWIYLFTGIFLAS